MSIEIQQIIDDARAEAEKEGRKEAAELANYLWSNGRGDDALRAAEDSVFFDKLLAELRGGMMVAK